MIRRILTAVLCLMLALALPLGSLAATQTTLTVIPGADVASTPMIKDLFDAISLTLAGDGDAGAGSLSIGLSGKEAFNITGRIAEDGLYVQNTILGDKPVFVAWSDAVSYILQNIQTTNIDMSSFSGVIESVSELIALFPADMDWSVFANVKTMPQALEAYKQLFKNDAKMVALIDEWIARIKVTDGEFTAESHDPATQMWEINYTGEDFVRMMDTDFFRKYIEVITKMGAQTGDKDMPTPDEMQAQLKKFFEDGEMTYDVVFYTANEGQDIVSAAIDVTMKGAASQTNADATAEAPTTTEIRIPMTYNVLTKDGATSQVIAADMNRDGTNMATMRLSKLVNADGSKHAVLSMLVNQQEMSLVYDSAKTDDASVKTLSMYMRSGATAIIDITPAMSPLCTFKLETKAGDVAAFDAIKAATPEGSTQLLKLTSAELESFASEAVLRVQQVLYSVLSLLPPSVLEGINGTAQ